jgi:diadenosine tetraphosphatase ApaH/serine/threonine PP2A family protein phosphatase
MKVSDILPLPGVSFTYEEFMMHISRLRSFKYNTVERAKAGKYYVIGDIHGDVVTFQKILEKIGEIGSDEMLITLGDYGDRGMYQVETWLGVSYLKQVLNDKYVPLRGNHEPDLNSIPYPHDIRHQLKEKFGEEKGESAYRELFNTFQVLPLVFDGESFIAMHGGFPVEIFHLNDVEKVRKAMYEILWNDPFEGFGFVESPRGLGFLFGKDISERWLSLNGKNFLIRGHEAVEGYKFNHDGLVITVFSRTGAPYFNRTAAFAIIESGKVSFETIKQ